MKKTLLSVVALLGLTAATAQVYTANDSAAFAAWTSIDADGDGFEFAPTTVGGSFAISYSYDNATAAALNPDNIFISPAIDLSTTIGATLTYDVTATDQAWVAEKYAVYIVTDLVAVAAGTFPAPVQEEVLTTGLLSRSIDISTVAAGQSSVYVVLRHYDCTDNFAIGFSNLSVAGDYASVEESSLEVLSAYPNPSTDVLNITLNSNVETVSILSLDGKLISNEVVNANNVALNVSSLASGVYFYEAITAEGDKLRNKFVKK
jgi:hypothetical protein